MNKRLGCKGGVGTPCVPDSLSFRDILLRYVFTLTYQYSIFLILKCCFFYLMDYSSVQLIRNYFSRNLVTPRVTIVFKLIFSIQMFVELYGENSQSGSFNYPDKVYLKLRRLSGSNFGDGNGKIKEYRQPLGSWRTFEFNRFSAINTVKCNQDKKEGISKYLWHMISSCLSPLLPRKELFLLLE